MNNIAVKNYTNAILAAASNFPSLIEELKNVSFLLSKIDSVRLSSFPAKYKNKIFDSLAAQIKTSNIVNRFMRLLISNKRLNLLGDIIKNCEFSMINRCGIKIATIEVSDIAFAKHLHLIADSLSEKFGSKFMFDLVVNKSLINGIVIKFEDKLIDLSLLGSINKTIRKVKSLNV